MLVLMTAMRPAPWSRLLWRKHFVGMWRSGLTQPALTRSVVGSNPTIPANSMAFALLQDSGRTDMRP